MNKEIILTKSNCNRIFTLTHYLKHKSFDDQLIYLTCHLLRVSKDANNLVLLNSYLKAQPADQKDALAKIKQCVEYSFVLSFWTTDSLDVFLKNKSDIQKARTKMVWEIPHNSLSVYLQEQYATLLERLKLCSGSIYYVFSLGKGSGLYSELFLYKKIPQYILSQDSICE